MVEEIECVKSRYWLGLLSEPHQSDEYYKFVLEDLVDSGKLQYFRFQREIRNSGSECIRILLSFDKSIDFVALKNLIPFSFSYVPVRYGVDLVDKYVSKKENRISGPCSYGHLELPSKSILSRLYKLSLVLSESSSQIIKDFIEKVYANEELADFLTYF